MAVYKVPQDVEADDKLIGPFSFRQFVYLIIVAISLGLAWGLAQLFIPLALLPLPIILFFGALALPLRKDQPMEIYLAAVVSYHLKPKRRLWQPDGIQELVEIVAPRTKEVQRTKNLSGNEAEQRLSYLAQIADTRGWAVRGVAAMPTQNTPMNDDLYFEAQQTQDILDSTGTLGVRFDNKIENAETQRREEMIAQMRIKATQPTQPVPKPLEKDLGHTNPNSSTDALESSEQMPTSTSETPVSPDIISLANNPDLSIETIAHEAKRIQEKEAGLGDDEVVISLR